MSLIITGGAGFIGSNLVRYAFAHTDERLIIVDKLTYAGSLLNLEGLLESPRVRFVEDDITNETAMRALVEHERPRAILNLAAESHVDRSIDGPRPFIETNIVGTFVLLEAARRFHATLSEADKAAFRFLHVSTDEVYGTLGADGLFSEVTPYAPNSPYAASKASADHLVRAYFHTYQLPVLITNCSNNYGPYQFPEKLIPLMILNGLEGRNLPIYGDGGNIRDWLQVDDHCAGILLVLAKGRLGEKYNIGGNNERTNLQVLDALINALETHVPAARNPALQGKSYNDLRVFVKDRPGHDRRYAIDATKIRKELGWTPTHTFEDGIAATVKWYVDHRDWCAGIQAGRYDRQRLGTS